MFKCAGPVRERVQAHSKDLHVDPAADYCGARANLCRAARCWMTSRRESSRPGLPARHPPTEEQKVAKEKAKMAPET